MSDDDVLLFRLSRSDAELSPSIVRRISRSLLWDTAFYKRSQENSCFHLLEPRVGSCSSSFQMDGSGGGQEPLLNAEPWRFDVLCLTAHFRLFSVACDRFQDKAQVDGKRRCLYHVCACQVIDINITISYYGHFFCRDKSSQAEAHAARS